MRWGRVHGTQWRVIMPGVLAAGLLLAVLLTVLLAASAARAVQVELLTIDDLGSPIPVRVHVRDANGQPYPGYPDSALMSHGTLGGYFYSPGTVVLDLPAGATEILVSKGFEWRPVQLCPDIQQDTTLTIALEHVFDLGAAGWFSGDTHVHTRHPPFDIPPLVPAMVHRAAQAEGLTIVYPLDEGYGFVGGPHPVSTPDAQVYYSYEFRNGAYGHAAFVGLKVQQNVRCCYFPDEAYPMLGDVRTTWGPRPDEAFVIAHPHTGAEFFDSEDWPGNGLARELPVLAALGHLDALDLASYSNAPTWVYLADWYELLDCGFRVPPSAGTDATLSSYWRAPMGGYRVYVKEDAALGHDEQTWDIGLRAGHSFVTNYPLIPQFFVNGASCGDELNVSGTAVRVEVRFAVRSVLPLDRAWIVRNGQPLLTFTLPGPPQGTVFDTTLSVPLAESAWLALTVSGHSDLPVPVQPTLFAHTSPVYVILNGEPIRSAAATAHLLDWIDSLHTFVELRDNWTSPEHRSHVLSTLDGARSFYLLHSSVHDAAPGDPLPGEFESRAGPGMRIEARPNPAPGTVRLRVIDPPGGDWTLEVIDLCGRLVASMGGARLGAEHGQPARTVDWWWDGRDACGRLVPGGCYWARMRPDGPGGEGARASTGAVCSVLMLR
jgi:hypothetical protein